MNTSEDKLRKILEVTGQEVADKLKKETIPRFVFDWQHFDSIRSKQVAELNFSDFLSIVSLCVIFEEYGQYSECEKCKEIYALIRKVKLLFIREVTRLMSHLANAEDEGKH